MKNVLKGKTVVITGASSGIGEAMAKVYAGMGAKLVLGARSEQKLNVPKAAKRCAARPT